VIDLVDAVPVMPAALELAKITKRFGRHAVLRGVDLRLEGGELLGLIGANGAGKTTLLSIAAGLLPSTSGARSFWGVPHLDLDAQVRARLALVSHTAQIYARLTARENLELFAALRNAAGLGAEAPGPLLDRLGLSHAIDRIAGTFSRGMLQRLALARALVGRPELLLLDEPFTALDRPGRALLADVLVEEARRGTAVLLSSHDFDVIAGITARVVLLEDGAIAGEVARSEGTLDYAERLHRLAGHVTPSASGSRGEAHA